MNCILCLNLGQIKCEQIKDNDYSLFTEYLYVCHQYLTVEFEFSDFEDCTKEQKYSPICSKCIPSVKKLVQLHNEILEYSNSFSKEILHCRNSKEDNRVDCTDELKDKPVDEIKSEEVEDDVEHEGIDAVSFVQTELKVEDEVVEEEEEYVFEKPFACEVDEDPLQQNPTSVHYTVTVLNSKKNINITNIRKISNVNTESTDDDSTSGILPIQPSPGDDICTSPSPEEEVNTVVKRKGRIYKGPFKNGVETRTCDICSSVVSAKFFKRHIQRMHDNKTFQCDMTDCEAVFTTEKGLNFHKTVKHSETDRLSSLVCKYESCNKKEFKNRDRLWHHYEYYHKTIDEHHVCEHCGKAFNIKGRLAAHIRAQHNADERFACTQCGKSYTHNCQLRRHIQFVHTQEVSYICDLCGKSLSSRKVLKDHYRLHSGDKLKCEVCGQLYSSRTALIIHRKKAHR